MNKTDFEQSARAVEKRLSTKERDYLKNCWNEMPDKIAEALLQASLQYAAHSAWFHAISHRLCV